MNNIRPRNHSFSPRGSATATAITSSLDLNVERATRHGPPIGQEVTTDDGTAESQARQCPPDESTWEREDAYCADSRAFLVGGEPSQPLELLIFEHEHAAVIRLQFVDLFAKYLRPKF